VNPAIIIPTYNRAEMVCQAAESALAQSRACAVVVVDDGSTDNTLERLARFGDRLDVVTQENAERGAARNTGARALPQADPLIFLDADDLLEPNHLEAVLKLVKASPGASLVSTGVRLVNQSLSPIGALRVGRPGPITLEGFLRGREIVPQGAMAVRRWAFDAVNGFSERRDLSGSEDWLFVASALALAPGHRGTQVTVQLREHGGNTGRDSMHQTALLAHRLYFDESLPALLGAGSEVRLPPGIQRASRARLLVRAAVGHYGDGEMSRVRRVLREAVSDHPAALLDPLVAWTFLRSLLGRRVSAGLRALKRGRNR
jgi:glycosyltransferase involved in cell wall biosynthesis